MEYLLAVHIILAILSGGVALWSWIKIFKNLPQGRLYKTLQSMAVFEIISGTMLAVYGDTSTTNFCVNIGIYTLIITTTLLALKYKTIRTLAWQPIAQNFGLTLGIIALITLIK